MTISVPWRLVRFREMTPIAFWQNLPPDYWWLVLGALAGLLSTIALLLFGAGAWGASPPADAASIILTSSSLFSSNRAHQGMLAAGATRSGYSITQFHGMSASASKTGAFIATESINYFNQVSKRAAECTHGGHVYGIASRVRRFDLECETQVNQFVLERNHLRFRPVATRRESLVQENVRATNFLRGNPRFPTT